MPMSTGLLLFLVALLAAVAAQRHWAARRLARRLRRSESAAADADERFAKALLETTDYVAIVEFHSGVMIEVNRSMEEALAFRRDELIGKRAVDIGFWADVRQRDQYKEILRTHGEVRKMRFAFRNRKGEIGSALITAIPVHFQGKRCLLNLVDDISEKENMRRQLERESERFRALATASSFGVCVVSSPGAVTYHNRRYLDITGQSEDDLAAGVETMASRWHPEERDANLAAWQLALQSGKGFHNECRYVHPDGRVVWTRSEVVPLETEAKEPQFLCTLEDVTAIKQAEQSVRDREARLRTMFDLLPDYVALTRFADGVIIEINQAFERVIGRPRTEILGRTSVELGIWSRATLEDYARHILDHGSQRDYRERIHLPDGSVREVSLYSDLLEIDGVQCALSVVRDIDEQERMRRQLYIESSRFRALYENSSLGVCVVEAPRMAHAAGRVIFYNRRYLEISGRDEQDVIDNVNVMRRWHPEDRPEVAAEWMRAYETGEGFASQRRYMHADGSVVWTRTNVVPLVGVDGHRQYLCTLDDVTELKLIEQEVREREVRLTTMFNLLPDYVTLGDARTGALIEVNQAYVEASGLSREQLIGRRADELGIWDAAAQQRYVENFRRQGKLRDYREMVRRVDGQWREVSIRAALVMSGGRHCVLSVARDIEDEQAVRRELDRQSELFRALADSSPFGICVVEPPIRVTFHNERYLAITGRLLGEMGDALPNWHADDVKRSQEEWTNAFLKGQGFSSDRRFVHEDGRVVWSRLHASPLTRGGQVYAFVCTLEDVTENRTLERERREREERFALVFDLIPDVLTIARADNGRLVEINRNWDAISGIPREQALGRSVIELGVWTRPEQRAQLIEQLRSGQEVRRMPAVFHGVDRGDFPVVIYANLVRTADVEYLMVLTHDMTNENRLEDERRRAEVELKTTADRLGSILSVMAEGVLVRDSAGRVILHNAAALRMCGIGADRLHDLDEGRRPLIYTEDGERIRDHLSLPSARVRNSGREVGVEVLGLQGEHGAPITWVLVNAQPVLDADGQLDSIVSTFTDITSLKATETALREREEQFVTLFQMSPAAMSVARLSDGVLIEVNDAWVRQFGYTRDEAIGHTVAELRMWESGERERVIGPMGDSGQADGIEVTFRRRDGGQLMCLFSARIFSFQGEDYVLALPLDVSRQRAIEAEIRELNQQLEARVQERTGQLEAANRELGTALDTVRRAQDELVRAEKLTSLGSIVAGVAHELNTPIGNSVTVASTLLDRTNDLLVEYGSGSLRRSVLVDYLDSAKASADLLMRNLFQAHELVSNFKQVAVDQTSAQRREFDLSEVINEIVATLAPMYRKTRFRMTLDLEPGVRMHSYPGPLGQILNNLVANSLAHGFDGREEGTMRLTTRREGEGSVELVYADDGVGIPAENLKRVFDPFFTTKLGQGGSGLGLNIVYNITTRVLGGKVILDSVPDGGVRFILTLPLVAPGEGGGEV